MVSAGFGLFPIIYQRSSSNAVVFQGNVGAAFWQLGDPRAGCTSPIPPWFVNRMLLLFSVRPKFFTCHSSFFWLARAEIETSGTNSVFERKKASKKQVSMEGPGSIDI